MKNNSEKKTFRVVGHNINKMDAQGLAQGKAQFVADLVQGEHLIGKVLRSPHAHARLKEINTARARAMPGVHAVLTYKDVPRIAFTTAGQGYPEPSPYDSFILDDKVRFVGDRVAAVAAESEEIATQALAAIEVKFDILEPVLDPRQAMAPGAPVIHDEPEARILIPVPYEPQKNLASNVEFDVGDVAHGFEAADYLFESEFETLYASHCALEPHTTFTYLDAQGRLIIITSTQVPFHCRRIVAQSLDIPIRKVRVIKPRIGGGFGGKQEVFLEQICSALTMATEKAVLMEFTRQEVFTSSRTRHPQVITVKTGLKKDGTITAIDMRVLMNTGGYGSHALTVACNSGSKVLPLFNKVDNIHFLADTVYTNLPVGGAYRGYGATQSYFAMGVMMDVMARKVNMDPITLYKKHHIQAGETSPIFQILGEGRAGVENIIESCKLDECIDQGAAAIGWYEKRNKERHQGHWHYGVGMVCLMQGSSIPEIDMGSAYLKMNEDGSFNLMVGATDLGTGSDTVLAQIAAEVLHVEADNILVYSSDTDLTPFDVGAYASSTTYLSGYAVIKAAEIVVQKILKTAAEILDCDPSDLDLQDQAVVHTGNSQQVSFKEVALYSLYQSNQFQIAGEASHISHKSPPPFSAHFAEVAVDVETGLVKVVKYVAAVDCGTAINPRLAEGQTEGSVINGIGYALTEEYIFSEAGKMLNPNFNYYKIPGTADLPELETILIDSYEPTGPFGAKSVSEISINGPMPAIANAIYDAVGVRLYQPPFTPERVFNAIQAQRSGSQ
ncbi:xanthine dehydrogenase family protein molybdopterin-binding subunit [candidate division CSSED10-310 bacterium]|uniref:Xanthine dehydrogenase family protein molybdopterin-binding subunit n=1 Tax=candidate division CSSED10-310 bacterium TaxID=2855610 RepID=A0ABV6Z566_UNCC1